jgi:hypothetical protein
VVQVSALRALLVLLLWAPGAEGQCDHRMGDECKRMEGRLGLSAFVDVEKGIWLVLGVRLGYTLRVGELGEDLNPVAVCSV